MVAYKNNLSSTERIDPSMDFKLGPVRKNPSTPLEERLKLVTSPSLEVIRLKRGKMQFRSPPQSCENGFTGVDVCKISRLYGALIFVSFQQISFKLGNFTNLMAVFPAELMDFPLLVQVRSWKKKKWKGLAGLENILFLSCGKNFLREFVFGHW